ncbi:hypothetical protein, partial [Phenylobacterium sp.]|uniref:hypothetical protein n=1 Tax=Phenylobacterium sp. TaxID=1871053 RepID=UPI00199AB5B6
MDAQSQWTGLDAGRLERIGDHLERNYIGPQKIAGCQIQVARHGHTNTVFLGASVRSGTAKVLV